MFAVFHAHQPDGTILATSESHPEWSLVTDGTLLDSRDRAEESLRAHLQQATFAHYEVPPVELRSVA